MPAWSCRGMLLQELVLGDREKKAGTETFLLHVYKFSRLILTLQSRNLNNTRNQLFENNGSCQRFFVEWPGSTSAAAVTTGVIRCRLAADRVGQQSGLNALKSRRKTNEMHESEKKKTNKRARDCCFAFLYCAADSDIS